MNSERLIYRECFTKVRKPNLDEPMSLSSILELKKRFTKGRVRAGSFILVVYAAMLTLFSEQLAGGLSSYYLWMSILSLTVVVIYCAVDVVMLSEFFTELEEDDLGELSKMVEENSYFKNIIRKIESADRKIFYFEYHAMLRHQGI